MDFNIGKTSTKFLQTLGKEYRDDDYANPKFFWYAQFTYNMMVYIKDIGTRNMAEKEYLEAVCNMA